MAATSTLTVRAQFQEMLNWRARGWQPAPFGRACPECGGAVWVKEWASRPRRESHRCTSCNWSQDYQTS